LDRRLEQLDATLARISAQIASAHPGYRLANAEQRLSSLGDQLGVILRHRFEREKGRVSRVGSAISALSPQATLQRGFSITRAKDGKVIVSAHQVKPGERMLTQFADGETASIVEK
jgi:exodeoxyribonuclease VII large subunit